MGVAIYRYRPPEIQVTLTDGGTLLPNTTYYITVHFSKQATYNAVTTGKIYFYRSGTLLVKDQYNNILSGAAINLKNNQGIEYNYISDENGQISYEVLEQLTSQTTPLLGMGIDIHYEDWVITIAKNDYLLYKGMSKLAVDISSQITLTSLPDLTPSFEGTILMNI